MKGKILGADGSGGTISGEDSKRYKFTFEHWKAEKPPTPGEQVDFEVDSEGRAIDVFQLKQSIEFDFAKVGDRAKELLGEGAASPLGARVMALTTGNPVFQISLVVLLFSLFFSCLKISTAVVPGASQSLPDLGVYTIFSIGDLIDYMKSAFDGAAATVDQIAGSLNGVSDYWAARGVPRAAGNPAAMADNLRTMSTTMNILYILYLAPIGAIAAIVQLIRSKPVNLAAVVTGIACVASFAALLCWRWVVISAVEKASNQAAAQVAKDSIHFGLGAYVILLCGLALLGGAFGFIRLPQKTA